MNGLKWVNYMELFVEQKNKNYGVVYDLLMEMEKKPEKSMTSSEILEFVFDRGIYTSSFEKSLLNKWEDETQNLNVLKEISKDIYTSDVEGIVPPPILDIEMMYLKSILNNDKINVFLDKTTIQKLKEMLKEYEHFQLGKHIEIQGVAKRDYDCQKLSEIFFLILKSKEEKRPIKYSYTTKTNQVFRKNLMVPYKIEYSVRDDKFYIIYYSLEQGRMNKGIISRFSKMELGPKYADYDFILRSIPYEVEVQRMKDPIVIEVRDRDNAAERAFHILSCFEKRAYYDKEKDIYKIAIYYYEYDEAELISRILSLGKNAEVISPENIRMEIVQRIKKAIQLYS